MRADINTSWLSPELQAERDRLADAFPGMFGTMHPWAEGIQEQVLHHLPQGCSVERTVAVMSQFVDSEYYLRLLLGGAIRRDCRGVGTLCPTPEEMAQANYRLNALKRKRQAAMRSSRVRSSPVDESDDRVIH